jgi:hypothetical protein
MRGKIISFLCGYIAAMFSTYVIENSFAYRDGLGNLDAGIGEKVSLSSISPDASIRVLLIERRTAGSRNFDLVLRSNSVGGSRVIFKSTDQEMRAGSERIAWSDDNKRFALLSRNYLLGRDEQEKFKISTGETFVLVYDVKRDTRYCPDSISILNNCAPLDPSTINSFKKGNNF